MVNWYIYISSTTKAVDDITSCRKESGIAAIHRRLPAQEKALTYLSQLEGQSRRISLRSMADEAGVSYVTMWKAARRCALSDANPPGRAVAAVTGRAWARVKERISRDLLLGVLPRDRALPPVKSLCGRYLAGYGAVRRALETLCAEKELVREGVRYYWPAAVPARTTLGISLVLFSPSWLRLSEPVTVFGQYDNELMRALETACIGSHLSMEVAGYRVKETGVEFTDVWQRPKRDPGGGEGAQGYVVPLSLSAAVNEGLFTKLHATGKPVVCIDEIGGWKLPDYVQRGGRFLKIVGVDHFTAGENIARALIALGHRRCAYLSTHHGDGWSRNLLRGLNAVFAKAGSDSSLAAHVRHGSIITDTPEMAGIVNRTTDLLRTGYITQRPALSVPYRRQFDNFFYLQLGDQVVSAENRDRLEPLLRQAAAEPSTTCWIASGPGTGCFCSEFLAERNSRVSLVAAGWSPEITKRRIASYEHNIPAAVRAAIDFLLRPGRRLPGQTGRTLRIEGMLTRRESLRAIRQPDACEEGQSGESAGSSR